MHIVPVDRSNNRNAQLHFLRIKAKGFIITAMFSISYAWLEP